MTYRTSGTCSQQIDFDVIDNKILISNLKKIDYFILNEVEASQLTNMTYQNNGKEVPY